ncbi:MAG: AI-2E family transporter [Muribaculaceae bacterium]|nr:AI-2E family transporter [Muribaculaceae bacterium]
MGRPFTFDRTVRLVIALAITAAAIWLLGVLKNVLLPFFLACLLSYILEPFVEFNQLLSKSKRRAPAVFITLGDGLIIIFLLCYFFIPLVMKEMAQMEIMMKQYSGENYSLPFLPERISSYIREQLSINTLIQEFENGKLGSWLDRGETFISASVDFLLHSIEWLLTFIYVIFILLDYDRLGKGFSLLVPRKYRKSVSQILNDVKFYMNKYFRSQLLIACCAAVLYCIGFTIVGMPLAIVMGIIVGVLYMIPYFQYITLIPVIVICFITSLDGNVDFWILLGKCGLVYLVSQCICDYILTPKIMGKTMGLNPAIILLSLSIWGTLLGIIGMIIALPLTTLLLVYYKKVFIDHVPLSSPTDMDKELLPVSDSEELSDN